MNLKKEIVFDIFRYQIIPKNSFQLDLFGGEKITNEELKLRKNEFFESAITKDGNVFRDSHLDVLRHKIITKSNNIIVIRLGKHKEVLLTNDDFEEEEYTNLPSVIIVIDNSPTTQKIAISRDHEAFTDSFVVANILEENFTKFCADFNLEILISPILDENDFWVLIQKYEDRIIQLKFSLIRPNLANISGTFKDEIRQLTDSVNSSVTRVELNAPRDSVLENVNQQNERIKALAEYSIQGGSQTISMKVKGVRNIIKTNKTITKTSIDSIELTGSPEQVLSVYEKIINK